MSYEIKIRLKKLFEQMNINGVTSSNNNADNINSLGNKNFIQIMNFLEDLESLIKLEKNGSGITPQLDPILNRIRIKLNEQVKAAIEKRISSKDLSKIDAKIMQQDQKSYTEKKEATSINKEPSNLTETNPNEARRSKLKNFDPDALKKSSVKNEADKILSSKAEHLNISQNSEKKVVPPMEIGKKISELKMDSTTQNFTTSTLVRIWIQRII